MDRETAADTASRPPPHTRRPCSNSSRVRSAGGARYRPDRHGRRSSMARPSLQEMASPSGSPSSIKADHGSTTSPRCRDGQAQLDARRPQGLRQGGRPQEASAALGNYLTDIKFDEPSATEGAGTLATTGTGKGKKSGVPVVLAAAVLDAGKGNSSGRRPVVDLWIEDHYKETVRGICQSLRRADDFDKR